MFVKVKYDIPINDFTVIPEGSKLVVIENYNEDGFVAVRYKGGDLYFNSLYFEIPSLVEA